MSNVPKLRFKEFSGGWEEKKLSKLTKVYDGTHSTPKYVESGIPFYSVEHVTANQFKNTKYIAEDVFEKENKRVKLETDDILMTRIGDIGTSRLLDWDVNASFYVSLALIKQSDKFVSSFLNQQIKSNNFQRQLHSRTLHVAFPKKINLGEIGQCHFYLPSKQEQEKIASFLTSVDTKIEQLTKKEELLKQYKKGVMQQIFSGDIRFKADDGSEFEDWEEKKIKQIVSTPVSDGPHLTPKFHSEGIPFLSVNNLVNNKIDLSDLRYISKEDHIVFSKKCKPQKGDVLLGKAASVGKVAYVDIDLEFNIWSPIAMIRINDENYSKYIYYCFQIDNVIRQILKFTNSSSQGNIGMGDINKIKVLLPSLEEQTKIANFLSSIDSKIEQVQKQLDSTKEFKKALLQQMFV